MSSQVITLGGPAPTIRFYSPALQGVELSHQFDQWVGGWFGHQGGDGACAGRLRRAAVPLCSIWARRVFQGPTLKTLEGRRQQTGLVQTGAATKHVSISVQYYPECRYSVLLKADKVEFSF